MVILKPNNSLVTQKLLYIRSFTNHPELFSYFPKRIKNQKELKFGLPSLAERCLSSLAQPLLEIFYPLDVH